MLLERNGKFTMWKSKSSRLSYSLVESLPPLSKKVIGLMKDELGGKIMKEFISLRPKMYSYKVDKNGGAQSEPPRNAKELRNV